MTIKQIKEAGNEVIKFKGYLNGSVAYYVNGRLMTKQQMFEAFKLGMI